MSKTAKMILYEIVLLLIISAIFCTTSVIGAARSCIGDSFSRVNLKTPLDIKFKDGIRTGSLIEIEGLVDFDVKRFAIDLRIKDGTGCSEDDWKDCIQVVLHYNVRYSYGERDVVLNSYFGYWGLEERVPNPFTGTRRVSLKVLANETGFDIYANDKVIHKYKYRKTGELANVNNLHVSGDISVKEIDLSCFGGSADIQIVREEEAGISTALILVIVSSSVGLVLFVLCCICLISRSKSSSPGQGRTERGYPPSVIVTGAAIPPQAGYGMSDLSSAPPTYTNNQYAQSAYPSTASAPPSYETATGGQYGFK